MMLCSGEPGTYSVLMAAFALAVPAVLTPILSSPAMANSGDETGLQCVPYARQQSGITIYGDARTWWQQAAGRYARGSEPAIGAVLTFRPVGRMELGHVATVSAIIDTRTILLDHANWSPINGKRGQIERDVKAVDVSAANDWSRVRVWYAPINDLGTTRYPVHGFIYNAAPGEAPEAIPPAEAMPIESNPKRIYASAQPAPKAIKPAQIERRPKTVARPDPLGDLLDDLGVGASQ